MTWWQWALAYFGVGFTFGTLALRAMWAAEFKSGKDDGSWTDDYYGVWIIFILGWPLIGPAALAYWLHCQGVFKAILTPAAVKKARK